MAAGLEFATPSEICALRALIDHAAMHVGDVEFDCPQNPDVNRYLERVDFYEDLPENVALSQPRPELHRSDRADELIELVRIRTCEEAENLMARVARLARGEFGPKPIATACATAITAATENVIDHAASPIGALVAAQRYRSTGLELAVVDLGAGIPATLTRNPDYAELSDLAAVERSLEDGVSSVTEAGRGGGLAELVEDVGRSRNATLRVGSGRAELTLSWSGRKPRRYAATPQHPIRGTWISVRLESERSK